MLEARIAQLEDKLRNATVIDEKQIDTGVVSVGTRVHVKDQKSGQSVGVPHRRLGRGRPVREQALERVAGRQRACSATSAATSSPSRSPAGPRGS